MRYSNRLEGLNIRHISFCLLLFTLDCVALCTDYPNMHELDLLRSILRPIDNFFLPPKLHEECMSVFSSSRRSSARAEAPSSFVGSLVRQKRKVSSLRRLFLMAPTILSNKDEDASQSDTVPPDTPKECLFDELVAVEPLSPSAAENPYRKRPSRSSPEEPTPPGRRPILQSIDNEMDKDTIVSIPLRSPTVAQHETPSSFLGSPIKKKRRMSSINRL